MNTLLFFYFFYFFFFVGQPHEDAPIEDHPGNLAILMSKHLNSSSIAYRVQLSLNMITTPSLPVDIPFQLEQITMAGL